MEWPKEALYSTAEEFLSSNSLIEVAVNIHNKVIEIT